MYREHIQPEIAMHSLRNPNPEQLRNEFGLWQEGLSQTLQTIEPHIGAHSTQTMQMSLRTLRALVHSPWEVQGTSIRTELPYEDVHCPRPGGIVMKGEFVKLYGHPNPKGPNALCVLYPEGQSQCPSFVHNPNEGPKLTKEYIYQYEKTADCSLVDPISGVILYLPRDSTFPSWVNALHSIRTVTAQAEKLFTHGIGYHPHHEQDHTNRALLYPKAYFELLSRVPLFDEVMAMLQEMKAMTHEVERLYSHYGYEDIYQTGKMSLIPVPQNIPPGNMLRYNDQLKLIVSKPMALYTDLDSTTRISHTLLPVGNQSRRMQILKEQGSHINILSIDDFMSSKFDSNRYPQMMTFAFFLSSLVDRLQDKSFDIRRNSQKDSLGLVQGIAEATNQIDSLSFKSSPHTIFSLHLMKDIATIVAPYLEGTGNTLTSMPTSEITEQIFKIMIARTINNSNIRGPDQTEAIYEAAQAIPFKPLIEACWQRSAHGLIADMIANATVVNIPGRE